MSLMYPSYWLTGDVNMIETVIAMAQPMKANPTRHFALLTYFSSSAIADDVLRSPSADEDPGPEEDSIFESVLVIVSEYDAQEEAELSSMTTSMSMFVEEIMISFLRISRSFLWVLRQFDS